MPVHLTVYYPALPPTFPLPLQYLREALSPFIHHLLEVEEDCEVDPMKIAQGANLQHNQAALTRLVSKAWNDILSSYTKFPRCVLDEQCLIIIVTYI